MTISFLLLITLCSVIAHELGHQGYFKAQLKKDVLISAGRYMGKYRIITGREEDYEGLSKEHLAGIYKAGIWSGYIFLLGMVIFGHGFYVLLATLIYTNGCMADFRKLDALYKEK